MKRFRLRFLLQEIDLVRAATLIGRSPECHITIEDPLVSRQHARIIMQESGATIEDLGSRNGVKVNGRAIRGITPIRDGDRLRIGTQELVFCEVKEGAQAGSSKTTGFLRHCAQCHLPYPQELTICPTCGSSESLDDDTMTGELASQHSWTLQLLIEVLDKAVSMNRTGDITKTLQRVATQVDERLQANETFDDKQLALLSGAIVRASAAASDAGWVAWLLRVHAKLGLVPTRELTDSIGELALANRSTVRPAVDEVLQASRSDRVPPPAIEDVTRLEQLAHALDLADRAGPDVTATNPAIR